MTRKPPTETSDTDAESRRERLDARRGRRTRLTVAGLVIAVALVGGAIAYGINLKGPDAHAAGSDSTTTGPTFGAAGTLVPPSVVKPTAVRTLDHAHPLKLWIGGDSLAGSFGPALGDRLGATGVVSTVIDYKTSSGLSSNGIRNWYQRATDQMKSDNPDAVVFIIGTNDASIVNSVDANADLEPDWETTYRLKIDRMMNLFVGPEHRTVYWLGPPTLGSSDIDPGAKAIGELMRQEAAKHAPNVVYLDTYKLFSNLDGSYSRTILDENGKPIVARISDGVHFTEAGADYLARAVFALIDARWNVIKQADLAHPIGWTNAPGSGEVVPGFSTRPTSKYRSGNGNGNGGGGSSGGGSSSGGSSTTQPSSSQTTTGPATTAPGHGSSTTVGGTAPVTLPVTTVPTGPHTTTTVHHP